MKEPTKLFGAIVATALAWCGIAYAAEIVSGRTGASAPTCTDGNPCEMSVNTGGALRTISGGSGTTADQIQGNVASGAADAGNPVKTGCKFNATQPTYLDGQRTDCQSSLRGNLSIMVGDSTTANYATLSQGNTDGQTTTPVGLTVIPRNMVFNGSTWDRAFNCTSTAVINITAGNTTQIVALSGSTVIRVCAFAVSMSAAGTFKFVYGTGANCGTGTTDIMAAMTLATGTPLAMGDGNAAVLRALAANGLCGTAVTGNATGYVSFAQY